MHKDVYVGFAGLESSMGRREDDGRGAVLFAMVGGVSRASPTRRVPPDAIPVEVRAICSRLEEAGERAWVVGGCLRDVLLERPVSDWDVATTAEPTRVQKLFKRVIPTGLQHGTVTVLWKGVPYEVTTLRGEGAYSDGRRPDEVFFVRDIEEDLARRDFTVNALAYDPLNEELCDPFGGLADLERGIVRAVGVALERFTEDGLRVLRAARFVATLEFELEPATERAIGDALDTFRMVSRERVREEWMKTMKATRPSRAFRVMRRTGILEVTCPELLATEGARLGDTGAVDAWSHALATMDLAREEGADPVDAHACLLHALGRTRVAGSDGYDGFERVGADMADRWLAEYRYSKEERALITHAILHHGVVYRADWSDADVRRFLQRIDPARVERPLRLADWAARAAQRLGLSELDGVTLDARRCGLAELRARVAEERARRPVLQTRDLAINGKQVMAHLGIPPSRRVGELLDAVLERVIEDPAANEPGRLLTLLDEIARAEIAGEGA